MHDFLYSCSAVGFLAWNHIKSCIIVFSSLSFSLSPVLCGVLRRLRTQYLFMNNGCMRATVFVCKEKATNQATEHTEGEKKVGGISLSRLRD